LFAPSACIARLREPIPAATFLDEPAEAAEEGTSPAADRAAQGRH
jgi:hypothetical protein